jgi:hypothetical protein
MTDKAVISGTYSDFKIIRSRKVAQLIIEVPIEQAQALITALGLPNPAEETWVAVARLKPQTPAKEETPPTASYERLRALPEDGSDFIVEKPTASVEPHRRFEELPYSQQAFLRCYDMGFRDFLRNEGHGPVPDAEAAAAVVRYLCGVKSRADIRPGTEAEKLWLRLNTKYMFWESARAA